MCNLLEHSELDARIQQARKREPLYAELTDKYLIPYEPPTGPEQGPFSYPEKENP